jgi:hypothetical protein
MYVGDGCKPPLLVGLLTAAMGGRVLIGPLGNEQIPMCYWTGLCYLVEAQ